MEPVGMQDAANALAFGLLGWLLLVIGLEIRHKVRAGKAQPKAPRPGRISEREMELVGEDYRVHVEPYFGKVTRRRQIIREVTRGN